MQRRRQEEPDLSPAVEPVAQVWAAAAVLLAVGALTYANSFDGVFTFDDHIFITNNLSIQHLWPPWKLVFDKLNVSRPVVALSLACNYACGGLEPWGYHLFNLLVHLAAGLALYGVLRRTFLSAPLRERCGRSALFLALASSLLWLVHPLQTQAVTYVIQRAETLAGLCSLLTLYCVIRGFESARAGLWHTAAVVCCAVGMATKPTTTAAPVLVLFYDRAFLSGSFAAALRRWRLYAALAAGWLLLGLTLAASPPDETAGFATAGLTPWLYARSQFGVLVYYLRLALWPDHLCLDYAWPVARGWAEILLPALPVLALVAATLWACWRKPAWGFAGLWFFGILAPTSTIMPLKDLAVEHRMYLSLAALCASGVIAVWWLGSRWAAPLAWRRTAAVASLLVVVSALSVRTRVRNADYHSELGLWESVLELAPHNARAHNVVGSALLKEGRVQDARDEYLEAVRLAPEYVRAHYNLGVLCDQLKQAEEAQQHYREALRLKPDYVDALYNLGTLLATQGQFAAALPYFEQAVALQPTNIRAQQNLASALVRLGRTDEALARLDAAARAGPASAAVRLQAGLLLAKQGRYAQAEAELVQALHLAPEDQEALRELARVRLALARNSSERRNTEVENLETKE
ncbi:MAG: tetratricopeptide repeat protein [Planctomycetota bacterium]